MKKNKIKKPGRSCRNFMIVLVLAVFALTGGCGSKEQTGSNPNQQEISGQAGSLLQTDSEEKKQDGGSTAPEQEQDTMDYEKVYYNVLGNYLKEQLGLEQYDEEISEIGCLGVDEENRRHVQNRGSMGLTYIYLRNDLHLERLSDEDRKILEDCANNWTGSAGTGTGKAGGTKSESGEDVEDVAGEMAEEMVVRTFANCITPKEITSEADRKVTTIYDESAFDLEGTNLVTMDSLVLQIATQAEYDENDNIVDENNEAQKEKKLYDLAERMEDELEGLLGETPIRVLVDYIE